MERRLVKKQKQEGGHKSSHCQHESSSDLRSSSLPPSPYVPSLGCGESLYLRVIDYYSNKVSWVYVNVNGDYSQENKVNEAVITALNGKEIYFLSTCVMVNTSICCIGQTLPLKSYPRMDVDEVCVLDTKEYVPSWKKGPSPINKRYMHLLRAVSLKDKIYVMGGSHPDVWAEVLCPESRTWRPLPSPSPRVPADGSFFAVAVHDGNKIVVGSADDNLLYLFDVSTHMWEKLDFEGCPFPPYQDNPPVAIGNKLFWYVKPVLVIYDWQEKKCYEGLIEDLNLNFLDRTCDPDFWPKLIYLGGPDLCLVYLELDAFQGDKSVVHCIKFPLPEITSQDGQLSLHTRVRTRSGSHIVKSSGILDAFVTPEEIRHRKI